MGSRIYYLLLGGFINSREGLLRIIEKRDNYVETQMQAGFIIELDKGCMQRTIYSELGLRMVSTTAIL